MDSTHPPTPDQPQDGDPPPPLFPARTLNINMFRTSTTQERAQLTPPPPTPPATPALIPVRLPPPSDMFPEKPLQPRPASVHQDAVMGPRRPPSSSDHVEIPPDYLPVCITNVDTGLAFQAFAVLDSGANGEVINVEFAKKLGCVIVPVPGLMTAFHADAKPFPRYAVRDPLLLSYGSHKVYFHPDVAPLVTTEYLILGRPMRQMLGISTGPIETDFPPVEDPDAPEPFMDLTVRHQRVSDTVTLSPQEEATRTTYRAQVTSLLMENARLVPVSSNITAPEALYHVEHLPGTTPAYVRQYPVKPHLQQYVDAQVRLWFENGKIRLWDPDLDGARPSYNFSLTCAVTRLPDGAIIKARVCADATQLNKGTPNEPHPLPIVQRLYSHMAGKRFHSSLDALQCFLQFPVEEGDQRKLAFTWHGRVFVFRCLIFGLKPASQFVQRVLSVLFSDMFDFLQIYIDDLIISSDDLEQHLEHLIRVIQRCNEINFLLSLDKSHLFMTELKALGNQVSGTQVLPDPEKVKVVMAFPVPTTRDQLIHQLSVANFNRKYIRDYSAITAPLDFLRSPKNPFIWTDAAAEAHKTLLYAMAHIPAQRFPDFSKPFAVTTDSSITGLGGVMWQPTYEGEFLTADNLITFCSRALLTYERRGSVYKLELAAILYCLRCFDDALSGTKFTLYTDCKALTYINTQEHGNRILDGWKAILDEYTFDIFHVQGSKNTLADALSRVYPTSWGIPPMSLAPRLQLDAPLPEDQPSTSRIVAAFQSSHGPAAAASSSAGAAPQEATALVHSSETLTGLPTPPLSPDTVLGTALLPLDAANIPAKAMKLATRMVTYKSPATPEHALLLVQDAHTFGHFGTRSVHAALKKAKWRWPGMNALVAQVCADCAQCRSWTQSKHAYAPLRSQPVNLPWDILQVDLITSFEVCEDGSRYILVTICTFTSFVLLQALPDKSAVTVADALWRTFAIFGPPKTLQSDNGTEFLNEIVQQLIEAHGIEHRLIAAYAPRMNGHIERMVAVVSTLVRKLAHETGRPWSTLLPTTQLMLNSKTRHLTGMAPFSMLINADADLFQSYTSDADPETFTEADITALVTREKYLFETVFPVITSRIKALQGRQEHIFDAKHLTITTTPPMGTLVMLLDHHRQGKSSPPYVGPYTLVRRTHAGLYTLRDGAGGIYPSDVPLDHLKILTGASVEDPSNTFYVDRLVGHKRVDGLMHYLVQWVGYAEPTWEPQQNIDDPSLIRAYFANLQVIPHSRDAAATTAAGKPRPRTAPPPVNFSVTPPPYADFDPTILPTFASVPSSGQTAAMAAPAMPNPPPPPKPPKPPKAAARLQPPAAPRSREERAANRFAALDPDAP